MWRFRVQLLSLEKATGVLDLLGFPAQLLLPNRSRIRARWWSRGELHKKRFNRVDELIKLLRPRQLNEIEVAYEPVPYDLADASVRVTSAISALKVSPTNKLWAPASGFTLENPKAESVRATYESQELFVKWNGLESRPSLLETVFEIESRSPFDELSSALYLALSKSIPSTIVCMGVSGCGDLLKDGVFIEDILGALAPWPKAHPLLGSLFDDVHPILIGDPSLCQELATTLGSAVNNTVVHCNDNQHAVGLLRIPAEVLESPDIKSKTERFLVPRDVSTSPDTGGSREEFRLAGRIFRTQRRNRELAENGLLPTLPAGFTYFLLVDRKYCDMLGLDPESMLVELWQEPLVEKVRREVDEAFSKLSNEPSLPERVWLAHERVYRKWLYRDEETLNFLRNQLLAACIGAGEPPHEGAGARPTG